MPEYKIKMEQKKNLNSQNDKTKNKKKFLKKISGKVVSEENFQKSAIRNIRLLVEKNQLYRRDDLQLDLAECWNMDCWLNCYSGE